MPSGGNATNQHNKAVFEQIIWPKGKSIIIFFFSDEMDLCTSFFKAVQLCNMDIHRKFADSFLTFSAYYFRLEESPLQISSNHFSLYIYGLVLWYVLTILGVEIVYMKCG